MSRASSRLRFVPISRVLQGKHTLVEPKYGDDTMILYKPSQPILALRFSEVAFNTEATRLIWFLYLNTLAAQFPKQETIKERYTNTKPSQPPSFSPYGDLSGNTEMSLQVPGSGSQQHPGDQVEWLQHQGPRADWRTESLSRADLLHSNSQLCEECENMVTSYPWIIGHIHPRFWWLPTHWLTDIRSTLNIILPQHLIASRLGPWHLILLLLDSIPGRRHIQTTTVKKKKKESPRVYWGSLLLMEWVEHLTYWCNKHNITLKMNKEQLWKETFILIMCSSEV